MQLSPESEEMLVAWVSWDKLEDEPWFDFIHQYISDHGTDSFSERDLLHLIKRHSDEADKPVDLDDETIYLWIEKFPRMMSHILAFMRHTGRS